MTESYRAEFEQAMGESFGDYVCPPVPFEDASAHECCEAVWIALGRNATPTMLASLNTGQIEELREAFGTHFESEKPTAEQIKAAVAATLARWPVGSLDEVR